MTYANCFNYQEKLYLNMPVDPIQKQIGLIDIFNSASRSDS